MQIEEYIAVQGLEAAAPSTTYSIPIEEPTGTATPTLSVTCDAERVFHVPVGFPSALAYLAKQGMIAPREETLTPAPDLQDAGHGDQPEAP